jgi:branched-chain amino acid transport system permease protein
VEQALVVGLVTGGIYGLYALGLVLVYRGSGVLNFAQAELGTFTLFLAWWVIAERDQPYLLGAAVAVVVALAMGLVFERLAVWPLRAAPRLTIAVATIALLSLLIALELKLYGAVPRLLDPPIAGVGLRVFDVIVTPTQILSLVLVVAIGIGLAAFLRFTDFGLAVQAAAQDQEALRFLGIRLARVSIFTWGLAAALSAVAALLIQPSVGVISASAFGAIFIKALGAALVGGLTSMPGAFVGGLTIGIVEAEIRHFTVSSELTGLPELCIFAVVVATLIFRPQGLLGERTA